MEKEPERAELALGYAPAPVLEQAQAQVAKGHCGSSELASEFQPEVAALLA